MTFLKALTIAGSDASGGAGIQADLKVFANNKIYGTTALTVLVSMDPFKEWTHKINVIDKDFIKQQINTGLYMHPDGIKTGMLPTTEIIELVAEKIKEFDCNKIVIDPVLACKGEDVLFPDNVKYIRKILIPISYVCTPNVIEAQLLTEINIKNIESAKKAAEKFYKLGTNNVIIKGIINKEENTITNLLYNGANFLTFKNELLDIKKIYNHGAGCIFSASILSLIIKQYSIKDAFLFTSILVHNYIKNSLKINKYTGCLNFNY